MTNQTLANRAFRQARRQFWTGRIDRATFNKVRLACGDDEILTEWNARLRLSGLVCPIQDDGLSQGAFIDWFLANWLKILEILLAILPLFLGEDQ